MRTKGGFIQRLGGGIWLLIGVACNFLLSDFVHLWNLLNQSINQSTNQSSEKSTSKCWSVFLDFVLESERPFPYFSLYCCRNVNTKSSLMYWGYRKSRAVLIITALGMFVLLWRIKYGVDRSFLSHPQRSSTGVKLLRQNHSFTGTAPCNITKQIYFGSLDEVWWQ